MENERMTREDYVRYDRVWQRVSPELDPYPEVRRESGEVPAPVCAAPRSVDADTIAGFIDQALTTRRAYLSARRCAPTAARRMLYQLAEEAGTHARRLMGLYYILTGRCYQSKLCAVSAENLPWCQLLRLRYQEACFACESYRQAAETAGDGCMRAILQQLSADACRHAGVLLQLLEGNLPG